MALRAHSRPMTWLVSLPAALASQVHPTGLVAVVLSRPTKALGPGP
jgi:hypothetical protein